MCEALEGDKNDVNEGVEEAARVCAALAGATARRGSLLTERRARNMVSASEHIELPLLWGVELYADYVLSCGSRGE